MCLEFLGCIKRAYKMVENVFRRQYLSNYGRAPVVRYMAVAATCAHPRSVLEMNRLLVFFINYSHFVARRAELVRAGVLHERPGD